MTGPTGTVHGPVLIGLFVDLFLYGTIIVQMYIYFTKYKRDRPWMKLLVLGLFLIGTINSAFNTVFCYVSLIKHFGDAPFLQTISPFQQMAPISTGVVEVIVQLFYAWRIYMFTKSWIMATVVVALTLMGGIGCIITEIQEAALKNFGTDWFPSVVTVWLVGVAASNVTITATLVWCWVTNRTSIKKSDLSINHILVGTMSSGLFMTLVSIADLGLYVGNHTGIHFILNTPLGKIFTSSFMSTLNSRVGGKFDAPRRTQGGDVSTFAADRSIAFHISQSQIHSNTSRTEVESNWSKSTPKKLERISETESRDDGNVKSGIYIQPDDFPSIEKH